MSTPSQGTDQAVLTSIDREIKAQWIRQFPIVLTKETKLPFISAVSCFLCVGLRMEIILWILNGVHL